MRIALASFVVLAACYNPGASGDDGSSSAASSSGGSTIAAEGTTTAPAHTSEGSSGLAGSTSAGDTTAAASTGALDGSSGSTGEPLGCEGFDGQVVGIVAAGIELSMGIVDNAPFAQTSVPQQVGTWPAYAGGDEAEILATVQGHFAPYHICITAELPSTADYDLVVLQSVAYMDNPNVVGFTTSDCGNSQPNNVAVVFLAAENNLPTPVKSLVVSNQIGHVLGLESVSDASDEIMNQFISTTENGAQFTDTCYVVFGMGTCNATGACAAGEQQSAPYLLDLLGPA